jgi:hypothetical protein
MAKLITGRAGRQQRREERLEQYAAELAPLLLKQLKHAPTSRVMHLGSPGAIAVGQALAPTFTTGELRNVDATGLCPRQVGIREFRFRQIGQLQIGVGQRGMPQLGPGEVRALQVGLCEIRVRKVGAGKLKIPQVCPTEVCVLQHAVEHQCVGKVRVHQIRPRQIGINQICAKEDHPTQVLFP